ncbi:MAG: hypothetical protein HN704_13160 [Bacteroidetes bacterium]|jgi:hypothetical protein|nr:hypothetical protein [Bacteroidota bacterium]MBT6687777.1 hypothetical protein [Bacteroidota bacterium]MBT7143411.1 hypothetical protein [Bacteroidota bacterium]MBT7492545.1 hypothetical protein [Bacteroidota bacterium]
MKRLGLLISILLLSGTFVFAQEETNKKVEDEELSLVDMINKFRNKMLPALTPEAKDFSFEVSFIPLSNTAPIDLSYLRGRYFMSDKIALRMGLEFDAKSISEENPFYGDNSFIGDIPDAKIENSYSLWGIHPGIEYHFGNHKRLSPFFGADFFYIQKTSKSAINYNSPIYTSETIDITIDGAWSNFEERAFNQFSLNLILGSDFYLSKNIFMGFEFGISYTTTINQKVTQTIDDDEIDYLGKTSETKIGKFVNNAIRLGVCF